MNNPLNVKRVAVSLILPVLLGGCKQNTELGGPRAAPPGLAAQPSHDGSAATSLSAPNAASGKLQGVNSLAALRRELVDCWCERGGGLTCSRAAEDWKRLCTPPADSSVCEPRERPVLGVDPRPPAPNVEKAACQALAKQSETEEQRWANVRTNAWALGIAVLAHTPTRKKAVDTWGQELELTYTLADCGDQLVLLIPAHYCHMVERIFATLKVPTAEKRCLAGLDTHESWVSACKAQELRPDACAKAELELRARCNEAPNEPFCPRPAGLDCDKR